ncbi:MAG: tripartite tricarboxylate transporter substrate binding protein [Betaproteobacteria bacterium]|nr:tripartite tricarboxylate transporter substrate binding protein [Betaproteobacteria bacterium]
MRLARVRSLPFLLGALCMAPFAYGAGTPADAAYPTKPIRLIVPFAPGGTNDVLGRMAAIHLSQTLGQTMIVDNRPGAEGVIGTDLAAKATPDGYTLVVLSSAYTMNPVVRKLPYDTLTALEFVAKIGASFCVLSVGPLLPVNSVKDLLATAERRPGEIVLASSGGWMHFASALFQGLSKQKFNIVLYKGGFPAMIDVIGGQAHAHFAVSVPALPFLRSGQLKGLAIGGLKRTELLPDLPTLDEVGVKGYDAANWYAVAAPSGTPRAIVMKLHNEIARFFTSPEMQKKMVAMGAEIDIKTPDEMRKIIPAEIAKWTKVAIDVDMPRAVK